MAISAPAKSSQYVDYTASPQVMVKPTDWGASLKASYAKLTFTAAGFTTAGALDLFLIHMPAGRLRILPDLSRVVCPAGATGATLSLGWTAHTQMDGTTRAADGVGLVSSAVITAAIDVAFDAGVVLGLEFSSQDGFDIAASVAVANSPAAGDLIVVVAYALGR